MFINDSALDTRDVRVSCGCRDLLLRRGADGMMAKGVGGAAAGVNGFLASENSGTSTWIGAKRPKRYIKCIRLQLLPRWWLLHRKNNK